MKSSFMNHPIPTSGPSLYLRTDRYQSQAPQNKVLENEILDLADKFISMDNEAGDLSKSKGYVRMQSPNGRAVTEFSFRERNVDTGCYRDREGYLECTSETVLDHAQYTRTELNKAGKPTKTVTLSYDNSPKGSLCSKTVHDRHGKSIAIGGGSRDYQVSYFPGDSINSKA